MRPVLPALVCLGMAGPVMAATININFGNASNVAGWNEVTNSDPVLNTPIPLTYDNGADSPVALRWTAEPGGVNTNGTPAPTGDLAAYFPVAVIATSFYGSTVLFEGETRPIVTFVLSGLASGNQYDFVFGASRTAAGDNRQVLYTAAGATTDTATLQVANNTSAVAMINNIIPDANGEITISYTRGPLNTNGNGFSYLGGLVINEEAAVPEPAIGGMMLMGLSGMLLRRRA